jgi:small subunit ribosomal protein S16
MQKIGRPHIPHFRVVAIHRAKARDAAGLEILGHYHPKETDVAKKVVINAERVKYWIGQGAQASDTLRTILKQSGVWAQIAA